MNKLILFELNEVPQKIVDYYCRVRPQSWMAQNYIQFNKFNSFTENPDHLNPWNTWPTVHRGIDSSQHKILDLNQDLTEQDKAYPTLWKILSEKKIKTGVFGSLHSYPLPQSTENIGFYVPDVFAQSAECHPKSVDSFQELNLSLSRKSARNVSRKIPKKSLIKLAVKSPQLGFKSSTISKIAGQLIQEKSQKWKSTRRRTHQANLSFDIFYKLLQKEQPDFTTFFTNHVAACLHRYWAASFPDNYEVNHYSDDWIDRYDGEILFALDHADKMLSRLAKFVNRNPEYKLIILSSMGQDAVKARPIKSQLYIKNSKAFFACFNIENFESLPAMLPQFNYRLEEDDIERFKVIADKTEINGKSLRYREHNAGHISIEMGHINQRDIVMKISGEEIHPEKTGLKNVTISDQSSTTADHIPEGIFYVYHPSFKETHMNMNVVPTCTIFPTILNNFGLAVPSYAQKSNLHLI